MTRQEAADLLGIRQDAPPGEVQVAFRRQSIKFHPDSGGASSQFVLLQKARDILMRDEPSPRTEVPPPANVPWRPFLSYPVRLTAAAIRDRRLRQKAFGTWVGLLVGLPLLYIGARDLLALLVVPVMAAFVIWAIIRSR